MPSIKTRREGHEGWDDYAPFYDWENAQTVGRRDVPFWTRMAAPVDGPLLELGSGTGRVAFPLAKAGAHVVGIDRSGEMLGRARARLKRVKHHGRVDMIRGDIRHLPFPDGAFPLVIAPYGILQSLLRERDLAATLGAVNRVLAPGGAFGMELVADLPSWEEYKRKISFRGRRGMSRITLVESVRQDPARRLTLFDQEFTERRGKAVRRKTFTLTFRTLSVPQMTRRLVKAGFEVLAALGDYEGGPWEPGAAVWIVLARKPCATL